MICLECHEPIRKGELVEEMPGEEVIHELCMNSILDRPVSGEKEATITSKEASREW